MPWGRGVTPTAWAAPYKPETFFSFRDNLLKSLRRGKASTGVSEPAKGSATVEPVNSGSIDRSPAIPELRTSKSQPSSPSPHRSRARLLEKPPSANTSTLSPTTLVVSTPDDTPADPQQGHRKQGLKKSFSHPYHFETSDVFPQGPTTEQADLSKERATRSPNQGAGHTSRPLSPAVDTPRSPSPAVHISRPLSPLSQDPLPHPVPSGTDPVGDPGVNVQQMAELIVKFVLCSDNPELKAALKKAVNSDPNILRRL